MQYTRQEIQRKQRIYKEALSLGFHHLEAGLFAAIEDGSGDCLGKGGREYFLLSLTTWNMTGVLDYLISLSQDTE